MKVTISPEQLKRWQEEDDDIPEPSEFLTPRDQHILVQRQAARETAPRNGHGNGKTAHPVPVTEGDAEKAVQEPRTRA